MIPMLYSAEETDFDTWGLGGLPDAISCTVTEERNGPYELTMTYPITGEHYQDLAVDRIIAAPNNDTDHAQPFRIYAIRPTISGRVTVLARHISYQLLHVPVAPFTASSRDSALSGLISHCIGEMPFTLQSSGFGTDSSSWTAEVPMSVRSALLGTEGSILDVYGGEYEWDRYTVTLHKSRGADNGVIIAYGKNLTDYEQESNNADMVTGIYPYFWRDDVLVQLTERILTVENSCTYPRILPVDLSAQFEEEPTEEQLRAAAQTYLTANSQVEPTISIKASFVPLWQTAEYTDISNLERVRLCDTVRIRYDALDTTVTAKVIQTVYNVLEDRYDSVELGNARQTLDKTIADLIRRTK